MTPGEAITAEGLAALKAEIARARGPGPRASSRKKIKAAREEGDLSENAEYHALKEEQGAPRDEDPAPDRAAAQRGRRRGRPTDASVVAFGSTVRVTDVEAGREQTFTLVGPTEADLKAGKLSSESPVAQRPDGRRAGRRRRGRVAARRPQVARRRDRLAAASAQRTRLRGGGARGRGSHHATNRPEEHPWPSTPSRGSTTSRAIWGGAFKRARSDARDHVVRDAGRRPARRTPTSTPSTTTAPTVRQEVYATLAGSGEIEIDGARHPLESRAAVDQRAGAGDDAQGRDAGADGLRIRRDRRR